MGGSIPWVWVLNCMRRDEQSACVCSFFVLGCTHACDQPLPTPTSRMAELGSEGTSGSVFAQEPLGIQGAWDQIQAVSLAMRGPFRTSVISSVEWALEGGSRK